MDFNVEIKIIEGYVIEVTNYLYQINNALNFEFLHETMLNVYS